MSLHPAYPALSSFWSLDRPPAEQTAQGLETWVWISVSHMTPPKSRALIWKSGEHQPLQRLWEHWGAEEWRHPAGLKANPEVLADWALRTGGCCVPPLRTGEAGPLCPMEAVASPAIIWPYVRKTKEFHPFPTQTITSCPSNNKRISSVDYN